MSSAADVGTELSEALSKLRKIENRNFLSPLRYPGGKRRLVGAVADVLGRLDHVPDLLVEPFAGGASVALACLEAGAAREIALGDADPLVGSFWSVVFSERASELAERTRAAEVSIDRWREVRESSPSDPLEAAFKCLYLNRTCFSGVLHAGPIGGRAQTGKYKIDCRFPRDAVADRIMALSAMRERVRFAGAFTYRETMERVGRPGGLDAGATAFWYLDPPYFRKADRLYGLSFDMSGHRSLKRDLDGLPGGWWMLSYDDVPEAREMYGVEDGEQRKDVCYSAGGAAGGAPVRERKRELVLTNVP